MASGSNGCFWAESKGKLRSVSLRTGLAPNNTSDNRRDHDHDDQKGQVDAHVQGRIATTEDDVHALQGNRSTRTQRASFHNSTAISPAKSPKTVRRMLNS